MFASDTLHIDSSQVVVKDTVFIPSYLHRNSLYTASDSNNISCKQYIFNILRDSSLLQEQRQTMFTDKTFCPHNLEMQPNNNSVSTDWIFAIILFIVFLSAVLIRFSSNLMYSFVHGCFSKNTVNISTKDGTAIHPLALLPVTCILLPVISFLIFCCVNYYDLPSVYGLYDYSFGYILKNPLFLWLGIYICSLIVYFFKILIIKFFSWVFRGGRIANYYIQIQLNFGILSGFCLLLPVIFTIYANNFYEEILIFISLIILVILYFTRIIRCFSVIINTFKFSHIYLFFYLCIVELLPLIIIGKFLFF